MMMMMKKSTFVIVLLVMLSNVHLGSSRSDSLILRERSSGTVVEMSSDVKVEGEKEVIRCESIDGFLPCTDKLWGQVFLIVVYEYLLSLSDAYIATGSELFFKMFGTGLFGASLFQMLGMIPRLALILVGGLSGTKENIQIMAAMGMGLLAGSVIMSLTLIWGSIVIFGDGVTVDKETTYNARIMLLTMIPFLILQVAKVVHSSSGTRVLVLFSLILTVAYLITYCTYQVFKPWIQNKRLEYLMYKYVKQHMLRDLLTPSGQPDEEKMEVLFEHMDKNGDAYISIEELEAFILGLQIRKVGLCEKDFVSKMMDEFDISGDCQISEIEFIHGLSRWLNKASNFETSDELRSLLHRGSETNCKTPKFKTWWNYTKAIFFIIIGIAMAVLLAQPLMRNIKEFSDKVGIPSFLVSYVLIPLALSCRQAFGAISTAREKTEKAISLTFSAIYGGVFMNNMMGLAVFLLLVYIHNIKWDVSAEVLVVFIICTTMGFFSSFNKRIPLWTGIVAFFLYPISLAMVYVLTNILGLS